MKPNKLTIIDINPIIKACEEYVDYLDSDKFHSDGMEDYKNDIYEEAMESIFGGDIFNFINSKIE